jgi:hypothetical protein
MLYNRCLAFSGLKPISNSKSSSSEHSRSGSSKSEEIEGGSTEVGAIGAGVFVNLLLCMSHQKMKKI